MSLPRPSPSTSSRVAVAAAVLVGSLAAPAWPDAKEDATILALQQSSIAAGKRTVTVRAEGTATRNADSFSASVRITSANAPRETYLVGLEEQAQQLATRLREARLPLPSGHHDGAVESSGAQRDPTFHVDRWYTIPLSSYDEFRAVVDAVRPIVDDANRIDETARLRTPKLTAKSSTLDADRPAVELEARQRALANARTQAGEHAAALGMKLGPPLLVGPMDVRGHGIGHAIEQGYAASGLVVFELTE